MFYFFHVALLLIITSCSSQKVEYKALENNYTYRQKTEKEYRQKGLIPLEHFLRRPQIQGIKISPNGKYIAYYKPVNDKFNIFVRQLDGKGKERQITQISKKTEPDAGHFLWKERETLIFFKYIKEERVQHIFRLSAPKGKEKNITPKENH